MKFGFTIIKKTTKAKTDIPQPYNVVRRLKAKHLMFEVKIKESLSSKHVLNSRDLHSKQF